MSTPTLFAKWTRMGPALLSLLRIVAALMFLRPAR